MSRRYTKDMEIGKLYTVTCAGTSLYRGQEDVSSYWWIGWTPPHTHGAIEKGVVVQYLCSREFDGVEFCEILHDGLIFYISGIYLEKATVHDFVQPA